jgi:hypothetical protein
VHGHPGHADAVGVRHWSASRARCANCVTKFERLGATAVLHPLFAADGGSAGIGLYGFSVKSEPLEVVMAAKRPDFEREWS